MIFETADLSSEVLPAGTTLDAGAKTAHGNEKRTRLTRRNAVQKFRVL